MQVIDTILQYMKFSGSDDEFALLVNNLGAVTCLEMGVIADAAAERLGRPGQLKLVRSYVGTFMTSLDMAGFSLSLLRLSERRKEFLDAATEVLSQAHITTAWRWTHAHS